MIEILSIWSVSSYCIVKFFIHKQKVSRISVFFPKYKGKMKKKTAKTKQDDLGTSFILKLDSLQSSKICWKHYILL